MGGGRQARALRFVSDSAMDGDEDEQMWNKAWISYFWPMDGEDHGWLAETSGIIEMAPDRLWLARLKF